jgi:syntaxin-binding protein 5
MSPFLPPSSHLRLPPTNPPAVGGPNRPPSKRMLAQARAEEELLRRSNLPSTVYPGSSSSKSPPPSNEGWGAWASRNLAERTEKLNLVGDNMQNLQNNSAGMLDDVNKFVAKQKRGLVLGAVKGKFGF